MFESESFSGNPDNMLKVSLRIFLIFAASVLPFAVSGQICRASVGNTLHSTRNIITSEVYEFGTVDVQPSFPGGQRGLTNYVNKIRRYPYAAYNSGICGRVLCSFVIHPDGSISDITVLRGVESSLDCEAVRIIENMPKWNAGMIGDEKVSVRYILPIAFRL